jgi:hypothetical protein
MEPHLLCSVDIPSSTWSQNTDEGKLLEIHNIMQIDSE